MKSEKHSMDPVVARRQIATFCMLVEAYPDDKYIGGAASAALGVMAGDQLTKSPEFGKLIHNLVKDIEQGDAQKQAAAIRGLGDVLQEGDESVLQLFTGSKGVEALFQALDRFGEDPVVRQSILASLHAVARK